MNSFKYAFPGTSADGNCQRASEANQVSTFSVSGSNSIIFCSRRERLARHRIASPECSKWGDKESRTLSFRQNSRNTLAVKLPFAPIERTAPSNVRIAGQKLDSAHTICQHDQRCESPIVSETATEIQTDAMREN